MNWASWIVKWLQTGTGDNVDHRSSAICWPASILLQDPSQQGKLKPLPPPPHTHTPPNMGCSLLQNAKPVFWCQSTPDHAHNEGPDPYHDPGPGSGPGPTLDQVLFLIWVVLTSCPPQRVSCDVTASHCCSA